MKVYKTKVFDRLAAKEGLSNDSLCAAIREMEDGLINALLGGQLAKKRIGVAGRGKSGSLRTIIAYKAGDRAFCIYLFTKNEKDNIRKNELEGLKKLSKELFGYDDEKLKAALRKGALLEVTCGEQDS